ncbi:hypothetical protein NPIL_32311 [Nephila pilipes]|uniref:Uncharacterized protein n=1 Tax=Nephila pilipes TaxID=299642 RepID=A0A8X6Q4V0_NEPPI|nr:hypothetical protein NPIL_32311 [Nephila pilipes]
MYLTAAHLYLVHDTPVCRGTPVAEHCSNTPEKPTLNSVVSNTTGLRVFKLNTLTGEATLSIPAIHLDAYKEKYFKEASPWQWKEPDIYIFDLEVAALFAEYYPLKERNPFKSFGVRNMKKDCEDSSRNKR